jgi:hypothetical protein
MSRTARLGVDGSLKPSAGPKLPEIRQTSLPEPEERSDKLQVIHLLHLGCAFPIPVADLTLLLIEGEAFQGKERAEHALSHPLGLDLSLKEGGRESFLSENLLRAPCAATSAKPGPGF